MAKRWKYIRAALSKAGYTSVASAANIDITSIDADGYVYYTNEYGDTVKAKWDVTSPIEAGTDYIVFTQSTYYLGGLSAYTATIRVNNELSTEVTNACTFTNLNTAVATRSGAVITAVHSGTTVLSATTNVTSTATTNIVVGQFNSVLTPGSSTLQVTANTTAYALTGVSLTNQLGTSVSRTTAKLYYSVDGGAGAIINANTTKTWTATGSSTLVVYDYNAKDAYPTYTGATIRVTVV